MRGARGEGEGRRTSCAGSPESDSTPSRACMTCGSSSAHCARMGGALALALGLAAIAPHPAWQGCR